MTLDVNGVAYVLVVKAHQGNPWRELELFTLTDAIGATGPLFFNLYPTRVEILDQTFTDITAFNPSGDTIRFFWNPSDLTAIKTMTYDVITGTVSSITTLPFNGRDPYVLDARTGPNPNRLYLLTISDSGELEGRISADLGLTWGAPVVVTQAADLPIMHEAVISDPLVAKNDVCVTELRE
jgi:hypothetical protein